MLNILTFPFVLQKTGTAAVSSPGVSRSPRSGLASRGEGQGGVQGWKMNCLRPAPPARSFFQADKRNTLRRKGTDILRKNRQTLWTLFVERVRFMLHGHSSCCPSGYWGKPGSYPELLRCRLVLLSGLDQVRHHILQDFWKSSCRRKISHWKRCIPVQRKIIEFAAPLVDIIFIFA
jgi:hypothetical protein